MSNGGRNVSIIIIMFIVFFLATIFDIVFLGVLTWFILVLELPSLIIDTVGMNLEIDKYDCQGLKKGGKLIGYVERGIIFFAFMIVYLSPNRDYFAVLNLLPWIIAGKGLFRFSRGEGANVRACAEWYILGTFMSILLGAFMSWLLFAVMLG